MFEQRQENVLHADILVLHPVGLLFGFGKGAVHVAGHIDFSRLTARTGYAGHFVNPVFQLTLESGGINLHFLHQLRDQAVFLFQQGGKQMFLLDLHAVVPQRQVLRLLDGFQGFLCKLLSVHRITPCIKSRYNRAFVIVFSTRYL